MLEGNTSWHSTIPRSLTRAMLMGILMGATALFIFYSPFTAPSGSHINPAVTLTFFRLGKMCHWDLAFYTLFQIAGGMSPVFWVRHEKGEANYYLILDADEKK